jgi:hypothetical protein
VCEWLLVPDEINFNASSQINYFDTLKKLETLVKLKIAKKKLIDITLKAIGNRFLK